MTELKPMTLEELKRLERLKRYRHNARGAIKDLQRQLNMWKEIAQKYMALHSLAVSKYDLLMTQRKERDVD